MKIKYNKKSAIVFVAGSILLIVIVVILFINKKDEIKYKMYDKYSLSIAIDLKTADGVENHLIDFSFDGENGRIVSSNIEKDSYLIENRIYYLEDETFYWYRVDRSYADLYELISSFERSDFVKDIGKVKEYTALIDKAQIDDILKALFIKKDSSSIKAKYAVLDNYVSDFNVSLQDIEGYEEVNINIEVEKLSDDYAVNTSRIFGSIGGGRRYKLEETTINIFEIGGSS